MISRVEQDISLVHYAHLWDTLAESYISAHPMYFNLFFFIQITVNVNNFPVFLKEFCENETAISLWNLHFEKGL